MKLFIKKVVVFNLLFVVALVLLIAGNRALVNSYEVTIPAEKNIIILGDSNSECAVDDSVFSESMNLSSSADSYFYSYLKLKAVLRSNSHISAILLSFSPHNIFDNGWFLSEKNIYSKFRTYYPLMGKDDVTLLFRSKPRATFRAIFPVIKRFMVNLKNKILGRNLLYLGKYKKLDRNILDEVRLKLSKGEELPFFRIPEQLVVSEIETRYLKKIVSLCSDYQIQLYLVNIPKREELLSFPKYGVNEFYKFYDSQLGDVNFLDFSTMEIPEKHHGDFVHLNEDGAKVFSQFLVDQGMPNLNNQYLRNLPDPSTK